MAQQGGNGNGNGDGTGGGGGGWTRRRFLEALGVVGGSAAVYESMVMMGLLRTPEAFAGPPGLVPGSGAGRRVLVLGAGVGGLTAALRLRQAGYDVWVLEAARRSGGRNYTVRRGDVIEETYPDDRPDTRQVCRFDTDPDLYLNAGPGRIPYHHEALLALCRELRVPLEPYIMETRANLFQTERAFGGERVLNRQVVNDTRGYVAELLAKAVNRKALDDCLEPEECRELLSLLRTFGQIGEDFCYRGTSRSGYLVPPRVDSKIEIAPPLAFRELLASRFWCRQLYQPEDFLWQPTLFEPVRGMDRIVTHLEQAVGLNRILHGVRAVGIRNLPNQRVSVRYESDGTVLTTEADFCVSNIPLPIVAGLETNFSDGYREAVDAARFSPTCKVGWQANGRFWEELGQEVQGQPGVAIFGGISWIDHPITQLWYPSAGFFGPKGVLTGAYNYSRTAVRFGDLSLRERLECAARGAERLHPDFRRHVPLELGLSIAWQYVPHNFGGWASWNESNRRYYPRLLQPEGRFFVVGDQVSQLPGWQEGAVLSAYHVVDQIDALVTGRSLREAPAEISTPLSLEVAAGVSATGGAIVEPPPSVEMRPEDACPSCGEIGCDTCPRADCDPVECTEPAWDPECGS